MVDDLDEHGVRQGVGKRPLVRHFVVRGFRHRKSAESSGIGGRN
jgi:hypothetical protein